MVLFAINVPFRHLLSVNHKSATAKIPGSKGPANSVATMASKAFSFFHYFDSIFELPHEPGLPLLHLKVL
jgi:hypothetical protein